MNGHDAQGDPALALLPRHPQWDAAHVDGGEDRFADGAVGQQGFAGSDGLVVAHVLVYGQHDAGLFAGFDCLDCLGVLSAEWFLREDTLDDATIAGCLDDLELVVGRHGDVEHLDGFVVQQLIDGFVHGGDAVLFSTFGGVVSGAGGDGDREASALP